MSLRLMETVEVQRVRKAVRKVVRAVHIPMTVIRAVQAVVGVAANA